MSEVYVHEPPTAGKVVLKTSLGPLDIELWPKECPKATRNFVQLCLEGYYDGCIFHRVVKDFICQTGDPTGSGEGGESIYEKPFKSEFHSRLRFRYRGLLGAASLPGGGGNGSQFFFTLGRADALNNKYTLFGKVTGESLFNLMRFNDLETDADSRPRHPPKVLGAEVLWNPFDDIVPRALPQRVQEEAQDEEAKVKAKEAEEEEQQRRPALAVKKAQLLSFGEDSEAELEVEVQTEAQASSARKFLSAHDLLTQDPRLTSKPPPTRDDAAAERLKRKIAKLEARAPSSSKRRRDSPGENKKGSDEESARESESGGETQSEGPRRSESESESESERDDDDRSRRKKSKSHSHNSGSEEDSLRSSREKRRRSPPRKEVGQRAFVVHKEVICNQDLLTPAEQRHKALLQRKKDSRRVNRAAETLEKLKSFQQKLQQKLTSPKASLIGGEDRKKPSAAAEEAEEAGDEEEDAEDEGWLNSGGLKFAVDSAKAYDLDAARNIQVFDPLNLKHGANNKSAAAESAKRQAQRGLPYDSHGPRDVRRW